MFWSSMMWRKCYKDDDVSISSGRIQTWFLAWEDNMLPLSHNRPLIRIDVLAIGTKFIGFTKYNCERKHNIAILITKKYFPERQRFFMQTWNDNISIS